MPPIVLCVPNISEGRDQAIIDQVANAARSVAGVALLDVDPGEDTHRTVITFAGEPSAVAEAAIGVIGKACELIDMSAHHGSHARMGAADVVPFVPVCDVAVEECVALARDVAARAAETFSLPIYLYGHATTRPERKKLSDIRKGEYEALETKLADSNFAPDCGEAVFNAASGATVVGVRDFLLAYNVNLNTTDRTVADEIAARIRQTGRATSDGGRIPGKLQHCQAGGWVVDAYGCAQVTMNLPNYRETGLHTASEAIREEARSLGADVTGSELIGLAPKQAMLDAGRYFLAQSPNSVATEDELIQAAIEHLGLNDKTPFDPKRKIVEAAVAAAFGQ
jgi:glutamate formiminotransferase / formiminotetrahydrofolate cyclodeaminase